MPANTRRNWIAQLKIKNPDTDTWLDLGRWAVLEGGGITSEEAGYDDWDGHVQLAGKRSREDATVKRLYGRSAAEAYELLDAWAGRAEIELSRVATNDAGVAVGKTFTYTGRLAGAKLPDVEKGSSDAGELELTLRLNAELATA